MADNNETLAESTKAKRSSFLSDMDSFSATFEQQSIQLASDRKKLMDEQNDTILDGTMTASQRYVAPSSAPIPISMISVPTLQSQPPPMPATTLYQPAAKLEAPVASAAPTSSTISLGQADVRLGSLLSSLKATTDNVPKDDGGLTYVKKAGDDSLRMASRIGGQMQEMKSSTSGKNPFDDEDDDDDDEEDEGSGTGMGNLSNLLTKDERKGLTEKEKASWMAKQADLTSRRKDFHGAVTLGFDGIFSWQMYGSAEAIDETGKAYTEYLMRCQYGTTWENMQPWITARRFREFEELDKQLRKSYPHMQTSLGTLPEKDFFRFLENDVVEKRRIAIEEYIYVIITKLPTILRSDVFNEFLGIKDRIAQVRKKLPASTSMGGVVGATESGSGRFSPQHSSIIGNDGDNYNNVANSSGDSGRHDNSNQQQEQGMRNFDILGTLDTLMMTVEQADQFRIAHGILPFDELGLGLMEEDVRDLVQAVRCANPQYDLLPQSDVNTLLLTCTTKWPQLRATVDCGLNQSGDIDFSLIPRAMQTEEDLVKGIDDFKSLVAVSMYHK